MRVSVVGAGLGGLALAQGLRGAGIEADVFERDPGIAGRRPAYRLVLDPIGFQAVRDCLPTPGTRCWTRSSWTPPPSS